MNRRRILIVDDEPGFLRLLKLNLERTGRFIVKEENDATNAVDAAIEFKPDLVLLDLMMPKIDGGRVAARLHADSILKDTRILFLTASISNERKWATQEIGGCRALAKPIGVQELVEAIEEQLAGAVVAD